MAYYDQFTKKPRSPRDDWRDDEETLRPERDGEQNRRPYGGRPNNGERRRMASARTTESAAVWRAPEQRRAPRVWRAPE